MRLSDLAKNYLDTGRIYDIASLSFEELVHPSDLAAYQTALAAPLANLNDDDSVAPDFVCPVLGATLSETVAVSSGQLYSQQSVQALLDSGRALRCPITRAPLVRMGGVLQQYFVRVPQVDAAIERLRHSRQEALSQEEIASELSSATTPSCLDLLIGSHVAVALKMIVSSNKIRLVIVPLTGLFRDSMKPIARSFLYHLFNNQAQSEIPPSEIYCIESERFGRCWSVIKSRIKLEMWFPVHKKKRAQDGTTYRLEDRELADFREQVLETLTSEGFLIEPPPQPCIMNALSKNATNDYVTIFDTAPFGALTLLQAGRCCVSFMEQTHIFARQRQTPIVFQDRVFLADETQNLAEGAFDRPVPDLSGASHMRR
jgi:hypothetical protein